MSMRIDKISEYINIKMSFYFAIKKALSEDHYDSVL